MQVRHTVCHILIQKFVFFSFASELEMLQQINHDCIVRIHGWTRWRNSVALVMEYLPGGNLNKLVRNPECCVADVLRLRICTEIARAISFLHSLDENKWLVHGDIKPENVLLTGDLHCKLADFGAAKLKAHSAKALSASETDSDMQEYTPTYAAPERLFEVPAELTKEQDTYSYGLIIFVVLTGRAPDDEFHCLEAYCQAITRGKRPSTASIEENKSSEVASSETAIANVLQSLMCRCWHQEPWMRPDMSSAHAELEVKLQKQDQTEIKENVEHILRHFNANELHFKRELCSELHLFDLERKAFLRGTT